MKNHLKSNVLTADIILLLIVLVGGFFLVPFRSSNALQVSFLAYTNDAALGTLAIFVVTNVSNEQISFLPYKPQIKTFGQWSALAMITPQIGAAKDFSPHSSFTFTAVAITNGNVWRVPVNWCYNEPHPLESFRRQLEINAYGNWKSLMEGKPLFFQHGPEFIGHIAYSPEITK